MKILPFQTHFRPALTVVIGNVDYRECSEQLSRMDELLNLGGIEREFIERSLSRYEAEGMKSGMKPDRNALCRHQASARVALRSMILMSFLGETFRGMSRRLAECDLFRWFCGLDRLGPIQVPSKSTLQEYSTWLPEEEVRGVIGTLLQAASEGKKTLELKNDIELERVWMDTTCVRANIHFPVDWVLLRDAVRTLIKATTLIREHGLKSRMEDPKEFMKSMNRLCIKMTHTRRAKDAKREKKKLLRKMKKLVKVVSAHAERHRDLLDKEWGLTDWTRKQAEQVLRRIDGILEQLPKAQKQAHERIIGERPVANSEKILSLYDDNIHVIVRGKAGAEVEFGNTLLIAEQENGLIIDWKLFQKSAPADSKMLQGSVARIESITGRKLTALTADRGFDSPDNVRFLDKKNIFNAVCPKSPSQLQERITDDNFADLQKRRSATEARIGIFKNSFLGKPLRVKRFIRREKAVAWHVLAHNLWVLARLPRADAKPLQLAA